MVTLIRSRLYLANRDLSWASFPTHDSKSVISSDKISLLVQKS